MRRLGVFARLALFSVPGLALNLNAASRASISIGPTFSGGEISKQYSYDMSGSTGIYEYGLYASVEKGYLESSLQIETGRYNRNPCFGAGLDLNGKYGILGDRVKLFGGFGFAYNGYVYDAYPGRNSFVGEYKHNYSPYFAAKTELFKTVRLGFEGHFDSQLYWKARLGLALFHF